MGRQLEHAQPFLGAGEGAQLVAALSLGVDLGFGQPMEHDLRQCLIALHGSGSGWSSPSPAIVSSTG